jgi:hypothetical protein
VAVYYWGTLRELMHLTGKEAGPGEILYFKAYKSHSPKIEQTPETAALMLGSDNSRGDCV